MSLQQIFDEAIGQAPPTSVDVDQVVRRQRRAARVRPALATLAAAAVLAAGAGVALQLTGEPEVQVPGDDLAGFPEYVDGAHVIAAAEAPMGEPLSFTFTPSTLDLVLLTRCTVAEGDSLSLVMAAEVTTDTTTATTTIEWFCTTSAGDPAIDGISLRDADGRDKLWEALLAAVGEPTTMTVDLTEAQAISGGEWLDVPDGTFAVAVAERVPFEEYPLPPRPATLPPLPAAEPSEVELRAHPADPNRPVETTFEWNAAHGWCGEGALPLELVSQTPGSLRVLINGIEVAQRSWWDYEQAGHAYPLAVCGTLSDGEEATITVEPQHMTGDWRVGISRAGG